MGMFAAVIIAVGVMIVFANSISDFVERNPTLKMLALSFLILIGVLLVADGMGQEAGIVQVVDFVAMALFAHIWIGGLIETEWGSPEVTP